MFDQFAAMPTSYNSYITYTINNINLIIILNKQKMNQMKKYHKIIQGLETIADIQLQLQNIIKLADTKNNQLVDIETTLLQASKHYKIQIGEDIYSISEKL